MPQHPAAELSLLEELIEVRQNDFSALYLAVRDLHEFIRSRPDLIGLQTVSLLHRTLQSETHAGQTQSRVLYRELADTLLYLVLRPEVSEGIAERSLASLTTTLAHPAANPRRAAAEALGSLPIAVRGPALPEPPCTQPALLHWQQVLAHGHASGNGAPTRLGRSLVVPRTTYDDLLVVKLARIQDDPQAMQDEARWLEYFHAANENLPVRFDVPRPLPIADQYLFRIVDPPWRPDPATSLHPEGYAIAFAAHRDYFCYINEDPMGAQMNSALFQEALFRNAWLLGKLTAKGIVHTAPIPLFHNRVQSHRRADTGAYEWWRGGRLDRWLSSCRFPNLGLTGPRDFEHLRAFQGSQGGLHRLIGTHLLSLLLVAGSYFRNQDPERVGFDDQGQPIDARDLFDRHLLKRLVEGVTAEYYAGFVGIEFSGSVPVDFNTLTLRMIDEMGVDRHMEEILRVADQEAMTDRQFQDFLRKRGCPQEEIERLGRGAGDVPIHTGPHLGAFNSRISLPELIDLVAIASALCVAGRYWQERRPFAG